MNAMRPRGLHGQVVHELGSRIMSGELGPGTVLDLPTLESELGVSRTVLRESLKVLTAKGLVDARQKRGTFVTERDTWNMLDDEVLSWRSTEQGDITLFEELAEVRQIFEPAVAALAARRATDEDIAALAECLDEMERTAADPDAGHAADADLAFHAALLRATHNGLLASLRGVIEHGLRQRDLLVHADPGAEDPVPSHRAVLAAVRDHDAELAAETMRTLLAQAAQDFQALRTPRRRSRRAVRARTGSDR